ncbi:hypothetical protein BB560_000104 [Smittium megazygosporum]|uniref:ATP synthase subunit f, mitochondrial n=1 Tax=Smittium megazygosporum TaxID=133381 RepID=A0A2T9ZLE3_9FUNG|nr:hypothetical protein BB560_000107 [Smittium megazygosporum]PVV05382.1 hypothetical protein BB560_000104 [Smittium megazygosporum]
MSFLARSLVFKRGAHTLREFIPPNIGLAARKLETQAPPPKAETSAAAVEADEATEQSHTSASTMSSADFDKLVSLYRNLPKGPKPVVQETSLVGKYKAKYIETGSFTPVVHMILFLLVGGYTIHYFQHIKYHKQAEHH